MFTKTHNIQKLKAEIRVRTNAQKAEKLELRTAQRALSEYDKRDSKDQSWQERSKLCDKVGLLVRSVASEKETLTRYYQARATLRGKLHMLKRVIHHSNGKKEIENWTIESQTRAVQDILDDHKLPTEEAKPAA